jgi:hypothetical protein
VRYEVYNSTSGPLEIVGNDGKRVMVLKPHETHEITAEEKSVLEKSAHFVGLRERDLVRLF